MTIFLLILVSVLPVIIIGAYIYNKDKEKEPGKILRQLFFGGAASCIVVLIITFLLSLFIPVMKFDFNPLKLNSIELFLYSFLAIALIEESSKYYMLYKISYNRKEFDYLYDMIVYSVFISLGFACFENILYVLPNELNVGLKLGLLRAISAIPLHACCGVFMGYYLGFAKMLQLKGDKKCFRYKMFSLVVPICVHGMYDYCAMLGTDISIIFFIITLLLAVLCGMSYVNKRSKKDIKIDQNKSSYCLNCGVMVEGEYCSNCGNKIN